MGKTPGQVLTKIVKQAPSSAEWAVALKKGLRDRGLRAPRGRCGGAFVDACAGFHIKCQYPTVSRTLSCIRDRSALFCGPSGVN